MPPEGSAARCGSSFCADGATGDPRYNQPIMDHLSPATARRTLIDMALARARPGGGSSEAFMHRRTALQAFPDLRDILVGIDWVVVGGVATRAYMPERATQDLNILIRAAVDRFSPADRADLESLIYLGRRERGLLQGFSKVLWCTKT